MPPEHSRVGVQQGETPSSAHTKLATLSAYLTYYNINHLNVWCVSRKFIRITVCINYMSICLSLSLSVENLQNVDRSEVTGTAVKFN